MSRPHEDKLVLRCDKRQNDFLCFYPRSCDGAFVMHRLVSEVLEWRPAKEFERDHFNFKATSFIKELEARGYDPKTIRFSIELKKTTNE